MIGVNIPKCPYCKSRIDVARRVRMRREQDVFVDETGDVITSADETEAQEVQWAWYCMACAEDWGGAMGPLPEL